MTCAACGQTLTEEDSELHFHPAGGHWEMAYSAGRGFGRHVMERWVVDEPASFRVCADESACTNPARRRQLLKGA